MPFSAATECTVLNCPGIPLFTCRHLLSLLYLYLYWVAQWRRYPFPEEFNGGYAPNYSRLRHLVPNLGCQWLWRRPGFWEGKVRRFRLSSRMVDALMRARTSSMNKAYNKVANIPKMCHIRSFLQGSRSLSCPLFSSMRSRHGSERKHIQRTCVCYLSPYRYSVGLRFFNS